MFGLDPHWLWLASGTALLALETLLPGVFLVWIGLAAVGTGLILWALPLSVTLQLMLFAVLGLCAILIGRQVQGRQKSEVTDAPFLNERGKLMLGQVFTLETAISGGAGSVKLGDSVWRVTGADRAAGEKVKVIGMDGGTLKVDAA
jgi:inner membrane protein